MLAKKVGDGDDLDTDLALAALEAASLQPGCSRGDSLFAGRNLMAKWQFVVDDRGSYALLHGDETNEEDERRRA